MLVVMLLNRQRGLVFEIKNSNFYVDTVQKIPVIGGSWHVLMFLSANFHVLSVMSDAGCTDVLDSISNSNARFSVGVVIAIA